MQPRCEFHQPRVLAGEAAELFCEVTGADRAAFCNTGSEAVMGTMRIARTVTGRSLIAVFTGADIPYNPLPMAWPAGEEGSTRNHDASPLPAARGGGRGSVKSRRRPWRAKPMIVTPTNTTAAIAKVTAIWLVGVNE